MGKIHFKYTGIGLAAAIILPVNGCRMEETSDLPNILWIVSEDNSAYFTGCYGNSFATTPNLDRMASEGFLYTHAYANCPVSAPARNTIITGVYAASNGNENMRSYYPKPEVARTYPEFLREAGYYCTNNAKTDYNFSRGENSNAWLEIWDESSNKAHYRNRPEGRPFFAIFNLGVCHESSIHNTMPREELRHDPDRVTLPPYHPDTPEMRHDWAQYYDKIEDMDRQVGEILKELEEIGEADNTIVFYYGDHGGILARSKRFVYETGTHVPFIIRIPEKYKHLFPSKKPGDKVGRLISFVDLAPTLLSITGIPVPEYMQGNAFLGSKKTEDPQYAFMTRQRMDERFDMVRAVRDNQYRYIRNYMPFRITMQHVNYLFNAPSAQSWKDAYEAGETNEVQSMFFLPKQVEELYDTENDPWEVKNLADDPAYEAVLERMRGALTDWMTEIRDTGLVPETEYTTLSDGGSMYDYMRSDGCPFHELMQASDLATSKNKDTGAYVEFIQNDHNAIRYWGAVGMLINKESAGSALSTLKDASRDRSGAVATLAAETLYAIGQEDLAREAYIRILTDDAYSIIDKHYALNSIDAIGEESNEIIAAVEEMDKFFSGIDEDDLSSVEQFHLEYLKRITEFILHKWGVLATTG
jgi:N-sulfoglucosamine sulfohydrolase